jgi:hypothetical protein
VGELKILAFAVVNQSDVAAVVRVSVMSKAVTVDGGGEVTLKLEPSGQVEVRVQLAPRRVNPAYSRDIVVQNLLDASNVCAVTVLSSNVDPHRLAYHASFYKLVGVGCRCIACVGGAHALHAGALVQPVGNGRGGLQRHHDQRAEPAPRARDEPVRPPRGAGARAASRAGGV